MGVVYVRKPPLGAWIAPEALCPSATTPSPVAGPTTLWDAERSPTLHGRKHAGSLEALRVSRPEAVDLERIKHMINNNCRTPLGQATSSTRVALRGARFSVPVGCGPVHAG